MKQHPACSASEQAKGTNMMLYPTRQRIRWLISIKLTELEENYKKIYQNPELEIGIILLFFPLEIDILYQ